MKKTLLTTAFLISTSISYGMDSFKKATTVSLRPSQFLKISPSMSKATSLVMHKDRICVIEDGNVHPLQSHEIDNSLKNLNTLNVGSFLAHQGNHFNLKKYSNGQFKLDIDTYVNGGGVGGATAGVYFGKFAVSFVGHGILHLVAACTGPAYPVTALALESTFGVYIETASIAGAAGFGMIGAVATGPV